jgi:hypothetical protein
VRREVFLAPMGILRSPLDAADAPVPTK